MPKPDAWPRFEIPSPDYTTIQLGDVAFDINRAANVNVKPTSDGVWADVIYPPFQEMTLYLTVTKPDAISAAIINRRERIDRNISGAKAVVTEMENEDGWHAELIKTPSSVTTPIQILATDSTYLLSGAAYFTLPPNTQVDSIRPLIEMLDRDILELLKHVRSK